MADNTILSAGSGGDTIASDEISSVKYQRVKLVQGADGVNDGDVCATAPLNVTAPNGLEVIHRTDAISDDGTALVPKFAKIDAAGSGDNTIVAAVPTKKIRVLALHVTMTGTLVTIRFESGASGTALTGAMQPLAGSGITLGFNPLGWFETAVGELLNMELGGAQSVDGMLVYVEI